MKFIKVSVYDNYLHKSVTDWYININDIVYFSPYYLSMDKIDYTKMIIQLTGIKEPIQVKCNIENFKDELIKLHSNNTHIV